MDNDGILVLGATNIPWVLDSAIRRRYVFISDLFLSDFNRKLTAVRGHPWHVGFWGDPHLGNPPGY